MPCIRPLAPIALVLGLGVATSALAETAPFPAPGFWSYPSAPGLPEDVLADSCRTGFSVIFADGHVLSILTREWFAQTGEMRGAMIDAEGQCEGDPETGRQFCELTIYDPSGGMDTITSDTQYDRDPTGALRATTLVAESSAQQVSYPQPCPDAAVRDVFLELLAQG